MACIYSSGDGRDDFGPFTLSFTLLKKYGVSYIFVGSKEREKYEDSLNNALLQSLGEIVFMDEDSGTYIVKVDWQGF